MTLTQAPFVSPFDGGGAVYYPATDTLLVLNPTASLVWEMQGEGFGQEEIASALARHFDISDERALHDVAQVFAVLNDPKLQGGEEAGGLAPVPLATGDVPSRPHSELLDCGTFRFGASNIAIRSSLPEIDASFFWRFAHRVVGKLDTTDIVSISELDSVYRLCFRDVLISEAKSTSRMMSHLLQLLLRLEHPDRGLLAYCHAAAISRGGRSLLMPGHSGAGKSTLTAFLVAHGFAYLADDVVAIGEDDGALLPFPTCLSIKSGSWAVLEQFYPTLPTLPTLGRFGRIMRYVEPRDNYETLTAAAAPTAIVFPEFKAGEATQLNPLPSLQTMIRLVGAHAALTIPATEAKLEKLIRFVEQTPAYELTYSELHSAMQAIEGLLDAQQ